MINIIKFPNPILRNKCQAVTNISNIKDLLKGLGGFIEKLDYALGISAPQIGVSLRFFITKYPLGGSYTVFINPQIIKKSKETAFEKENCLSLPGLGVEVERFKFITLQFLDEQGISRIIDLIDKESRIVQHEIDHLNGKLIVDHRKKK